MKYLKRFNESNSSDVIRQEFNDIFGEYNVSLGYQDQGDKIVCYIFQPYVSRVSTAGLPDFVPEIKELVLHFISFMTSEMDTELISLGIKHFNKKIFINYYNEEPNRWGVHHPYYTGRNLNDLFDIQDLDVSSIESIELKFRKLKSFNENTSFEWLDKQNNESYFELVSILQSEVFDDFDVYPSTTETFDDDDNYPDHKFWLYQVDGKLVAPKDLNGVISSIFVYNITPEEKDSFFESLRGLETIVEDITGKQLIIGEEAYYNDRLGDVYDFIIKLK
jgi:hypothetical protein